ncbi:MAG TPA: ABC transporter permease [Jiangellaceae bacterium]|nr:ABC transporter permease [Jiangellaceae bacterium]
MGRYVMRRLLQFIPTVLGAMFLLHYLTSVGIQFSANPVRALFGDRTPTPELLQNLSEALGLGDECLTRKGDPCLGLFVERMQNVFLEWDFGVNFRLRPVTELIAEALPYTLRLALIALVFEAVVGIVAGVLAGLRNGSFWDYLVKISTVTVIAVPIFVLGFVVREFVGVQFGNILRDASWVPDLISEGVFGSVYKSDYPWASLIIPGLVLGSVSLAAAARLTRTSILENTRSDYVRTAKSKGLGTNRVVGVHTLRNSLIPVVTFLGVDLGTLIGGALITETIFNVPGIGRLVVASARTGEASVVIGGATFLVLVYLITSLLVDILYAVLDPRIRYE